MSPEHFRLVPVNANPGRPHENPIPLFMKTKPSFSRWLLSFSLIAAPAWAATITVAPTGGDYSTIQAAINAAAPGDTIQVAAGTYNEAPIISKRVSLIGAGSNAATGTVITANSATIGSTTGGALQITASGLSQAEPVLIKGIRVQPSGVAGISVGFFASDVAPGTTVEHVKLDDVAVVGNHSAPCTEQERGLYVGRLSTLRDLVVTGCAFDNLNYGWYLMKEIAVGDTSTVENVTVTNTSFSNNTNKGLYAEKLSNASFTGCTVTSNGDSSAGFGACSYFVPFLAGVDINLKAGTYGNLSFDGCTFSNNGLGVKEGVGLTVKGRSDGSYADNPGSVDTVSISNCTITGNERGVRFGEPGKSNPTPTNVTISTSNISGNVKTYAGTDGSDYGDVVNATSELTAGIAANTAQWNLSPGSSLQSAVNAASPGDTLVIANGTYTLTSTLNILKPLTLLGESQAGVIINASANGTGYGIRIEADNVTLGNFTLLPPVVPASRGTSGGGGFAVHASFNHTVPYAAYSNLSLHHISVSNGNRTAFDVHGYNGVTLSNLSASNSAYGNGLQLTGCTNATITGCSATGNAWGGLAFYASRSIYLNRPCSSISYNMAANLQISDVYVEDDYGLVNGVSVSGGTYLVDNNYDPGTAFMHRYTNGNLATAGVIANLLNTKYANVASTVEELVGGGMFVSDGMSIQAAINAADPGSVINVAAGTYAENIVVSKPVDIRGPNTGVAGNGTRAPEAVVMPADSAISSGEIIHVAASDVSIRGLTIDGDNPTLTSGFLGANGADIDAAEGVTSYETQINNLTVSNNIIRNLSYFGVTLYDYPAGSATAGHVVSGNLIKDLGTYDTGSGVAKWGGGVLVYNNQYTRVTDNVMQNVRLGVQTGNFHRANPQPAFIPAISGNTIQARRTGIFHNLHYSAASAYTLADNTITGLADTNETGARGILLSSLSVPSTSSGNTIDMSGITTPTSGYEVWNVKAVSPAAITGGSVSGATTGLFLNNYEGYSSNAGDGAHATVSGLAITCPASGTGIRVLDSPSSTHAAVSLAIGSGVSVMGGTRGLVVENTSASVAGVSNLVLSGQTGNHIELINNAGNIDATAVSFNGKIGSAMNLGELFAVESKVLHQNDNPSLGLVTWLPGWTPSVVTISNAQTTPDLSIPAGTKIVVTPNGSLGVGNLDIADGAALEVNGGELDLGDGSVISGTFTIFNSFGSWDINGDTTFNIGQSLALISDIHVAAGKTVTVNGGGELILDGCIIDSQTPGSPYNFTAATDGLLTIARCVVTDANIDVNTTIAGNLRSRIYDNGFITSDIEASAASKVYHNLLDTATAANANTDATSAFDPVDGWGNVTSASSLQNKFTLDFNAPVDPTRTLDANGNLFVQTADPVVMRMDVATLGSNAITAAEALLGYNSAMLTPTGAPFKVTPQGDWEVIVESAPAPSGLGIVDSALGLQLEAGEGGTTANSTIANVNFTAGAAGKTLGFFRVQTNRQFAPDGSLIKDTRLTKSTAGVPSLLEAFTANTGELIIDNETPTIAEASVNGTQVQPTYGTVDVLDPSPTPPSTYVIRNGTPVVLTFTATDAGLAGLDAADAIDDLELSATNGTTVLSDWTVSASESLGVVTYTVTLNVPAASTTGTYAVTATVIDRSGNLSPVASLGSFQIANEVLATVELQGFGGGNRDVVFTATNGSGTVLTTWTKSVAFTGAIGTVPLEAVPATTAAISAKTAWNLRSKKTTTFSPEGVAAVSLTGADLLPAGDITGDNVVNTLDYSVLRYHWMTDHAVADLTGDGQVTTADYGLLRDNFYTVGDAQ